MNIKKLAIVTLISAGSFLGLSSTASANCAYSGKVERVYTNGNTAYIYMLPQTSLNNPWFQWFRTTDRDLMTAVANAKHGNHLVRVFGLKAGGCTFGNGGNFGGNISYILRY